MILEESMNETYKPPTKPCGFLGKKGAVLGSMKGVLSGFAGIWEEKSEKTAKCGKKC